MDTPMFMLYNLINNIPTIIYLTLLALMVGKSFLVMAIALIVIGWLAGSGLCLASRRLMISSNSRASAETCSCPAALRYPFFSLSM